MLKEEICIINKYYDFLESSNYLQVFQYFFLPILNVFNIHPHNIRPETWRLVQIISYNTLIIDVLPAKILKLLQIYLWSCNTQMLQLNKIKIWTPFPICLTLRLVVGISSYYLCTVKLWSSLCEQKVALLLLYYRNITWRSYCRKSIIRSSMIHSDINRKSSRYEYI